MNEVEEGRIVGLSPLVIMKSLAYLSNKGMNMYRYQYAGIGIGISETSF